LLRLLLLLFLLLDEGQRRHKKSNFISVANNPNSKTILAPCVSAEFYFTDILKSIKIYDCHLMGANAQFVLI